MWKLFIFQMDILGFSCTVIISYIWTMFVLPICRLLWKVFWNWRETWCWPRNWVPCLETHQNCRRLQPELIDIYRYFKIPNIVIKFTITWSIHTKENDCEMYEMWLRQRICLDLQLLFETVRFHTSLWMIIYEWSFYYVTYHVIVWLWCCICDNIINIF